MLKTAVKDHFGSYAAIARALGIQRAAVSKWPEKVPREWAAQIHFVTGGKVRFNPADYSLAVHRSVSFSESRKGT